MHVGTELWDGSLLISCDMGVSVLQNVVNISIISAEGYLTSCTFDYLTETPANKAFVACIFVYSYVIPLTLTLYFYSRIVGHVSDHEKLLREQVGPPPLFTNTLTRLHKVAFLPALTLSLQLGK